LDICFSWRFFFISLSSAVANISNCDPSMVAYWQLEDDWGLAGNTLDVVGVSGEGMMFFEEYC